MWQQVLVGTIVAIAVIVVTRKFWKDIKKFKLGDSACSCGSSKCGLGEAKQDCEHRH